MLGNKACIIVYHNALGLENAESRLSLSVSLQKSESIQRDLDEERQLYSYDQLDEFQMEQFGNKVSRFLLEPTVMLFEREYDENPQNIQINQVRNYLPSP